MLAYILGIFPTAKLAHKYAHIYARIYASGIQALNATCCFSYAMDGLSADKLRIFLNPIELETKSRKKAHENESASPEETAVTTLTSVADRRDQVLKTFTN
jgi:hypothetical protein